MNLQSLQYVVEIDNCGSISSAAKRLFVSQPYLSKILKETEDSYGITIFSRSKSGIIPTDSGRLFLEMARELLENADNFERAFQDRADSYRLQVSSCTCSHPNDAFIRMLNSLPDNALRFSYREASNSEVIKDVYTNKADIGVIIHSPQDQQEVLELLNYRHLEYRRLFQSSHCLFCREGHPILEKKGPLTLEDIYQYNFALYDSQNFSGHSIQNIYNRLSMDQIDWSRIKQIVRVTNRSTLHNVLGRTDYLGIGISPILEQRKNYHIVCLPFPEEIVPGGGFEYDNILAYIYPKNRELPKAARVYITFLEQCYGKQSNYLSSISEEFCFLE